MRFMERIALGSGEAKPVRVLTRGARKIIVWRNHRGANRRRRVRARRLRVRRGSAADPLNLLQVMLAKGPFFVRPAWRGTK